MKYFKVLLILTVLGIAMAGMRQEREAETSMVLQNRIDGVEEAGFGSFFKKSFKKVSGVAKKAVNTAKDVGKKSVNGVKDVGKKSVNGVKDGVVNKVGKDLVVDKIGNKFGKDILVDKFGKGIIVNKFGKDIVVNKLGKDIIINKIGKGGVMQLVKITEEESKKYIGEVEKIAKTVGKKIDPRQLTKVFTAENMQQMLKGIQLVAGPMEQVMTSPMFESLMGSHPLLKTAYGFLTAGVKLVNHPEDYQNILLDSNPVSDCIGHFVIDTVKNPNNWMQNLMTAAPKAMEVIELAGSVAAMAV